MTRDQALPYVSFCVDDTLAERSIDDMPADARLVGWQCGFEPLFVAVWSYLPGVRLLDVEAEEIAISMLEERKWFSGPHPTDPDYMI